MRFGTWSVRLFENCVKGTGKVGVQEVRWDKGGTEPADDSSMAIGMLIIT
jgi:hypothetical protein